MIFNFPIIIAAILLLSARQTRPNNLEFVERHMTQIKIRKLIKEAKSDVLDVQEYTHLNYQEYIDMIPALEENKNLVRSVVLEEEYPFLTPNICHEGRPCRTKMFEIVDQSLGRTKIKSMPTILVLAGFDGAENTGICVVTSMIQLLQKMYTSIRDWYNLINTVRILAIPAINMQGFYHQVEFEQRTVNGKTVFPNPKMDFNLQTNQPCFLSLSAQFLSMIHQDNLIYGALLFTGSDFQVDYPRLREIFPSYQENADDRIYEDVAELMSKFFEKHKPDNVPAEAQDESQKPASHYFSDSGTYYQEWAYASSEHKKYVTKSCMSKTGNFADKYLPPTENTHRTFVIGMGLNVVDKTASEGKDEPVMRDISLGNELYVVNPSHPNAKKGMVSLGILFLNQFTKVLRPFAIVSDIFKKPHDDNEFFTSDFFFDIGVKGCLRVSEVSVTEPKPTRQELVKVDESSMTVVKKNFLINMVYRGIDSLPMSTPVHFDYTVDCNHHFAGYQEQFGEPDSLFGRSQLNADFYLQHNKWSIYSTNLDSNTLRNLILQKVDKMLIFTKMSGISLVFYQTVLPIQVGPFFPLNLNFDRSSGLVDFELNPQEIPPPSRPIPKRDYSTEFGSSTSITNARNNPKLIRTMNDLLKVTDNKFHLFIYNNYIDFIRSEIKLENLARFELPDTKGRAPPSPSQSPANYEKILKKNDQRVYAELTRQIEHYFKISATPESTCEVAPEAKGSANTATDKGKPANQVDTVNTVNTAKTANTVNTANTTNQANRAKPPSQPYLPKQIYFAEFDKEVNDYMLPSAYLDLLGRPVTISFQFASEEPSEKDATKKSLMGRLKDDLQSQHQTREKLNGMIVIRDRLITGTLDRGALTPFPKASEVIEMKANQSVFIPHNGLVCSTVMPYLPVLTQNLFGLLSETLHKKKIFPKQKVFYGLTVVPQADDLSQSAITLYVRSKKKVKSYRMYNKNRQFVLRPTDRIIQMNGDMGRYTKEVQIFQGVFPTSELKLTGKFVVVFEKNAEEPVFDCFLSANYQDISMKSLFTYSVAISEEQRMIKKILERIEEEKTWSHVILSIFKNPVFLIILGSSFCVLLYLIIKSNIKSGQHNQLIGPLADIKHNEEVVRRL